MVLHNRNKNILALLISFSVCINILELSIPSFPMLPWLKPGLANTFALSALVLLGWKEALFLTISRSIISAMIGGIPLTSLFLGMSGGIISVFLMSIMYYLTNKSSYFSIYSVSWIGAFAHTSTQLLIAYFLFIKADIIFAQMFLIGILSILTGSVTAFISFRVTEFIKSKTVFFIDTTNVQSKLSIELTTKDKIILGFLPLIIATIIFINTLYVMLIISIFLILTRIIISRKSKNKLLFLRFLPFMFLTLILNGLSITGHYLYSTIFTIEGLEYGTLLSLRFLNFILISMIFLTSARTKAFTIYISKKVPKFKKYFDVLLLAFITTENLVMIFGKANNNIKDLNLKEKIKKIPSELEKALEEIITNPKEILK